MKDDLVEIITKEILESEKPFVDKFLNDHFPKCDKDLVLTDLTNTYVSMNYRKLFEHTLQGSEVDSDTLKEIITSNTYAMISDLYSK